MTDLITPDEVLVERRGRALWITLNRPEALNALNLAMARTIHRALFNAAADPDVERIVIEGAGDRAFCAGGDVALLARRGREDKALYEGFFHDEYRMNQTIARIPTPYVAILDGVTMGGGVGLSIHGPFRVVTERTLFAMPETGIGLIPDVGGTHALARLPGQIGTWLALTGARLKAADCLYAEIATHYVPSDRLPVLRDLLAENAEPVEDILETLHGSAGLSSLPALRDGIDYHFGHDSVEAILASLDEGDDWAQAQAAIIRRMSPTSCKLTLAGLRSAADESIEDALITEYRMVCEIRNGHDFFEGVRAQLLDKDRNPLWSPARLEDVTDEDIARHLAEPESGDLTFE
ncbi:enoyl-CoA hydratase/isomerase family protein [Polymorphobacter fuscus]|uniref:3-hydroxyisobutyryl-CoA hydrolase n=1 Tax=Sandarakinorhabdus fusca TaxID=1439888 RepID=A0A7C9KUX1_9SPHN|nr:enoyl-CoA hydratase/isomerase family protein [Polymorphobacter fuscus]KAB7648313.1 enoyl-CoA hydratase/isomerase family protein [Polymorphobacter fuscus]MQT15825.1 enoyl-CoA hydratase/isomerase family protein [Polymorphobacter fuscus]NJC07901.1 enoyl-CoA hydratase [Polymorphobacter fuscus]